MYLQNLYLKDNPRVLFAKEFTRIVHGGRGDYVEFTRSQIIPKLFYKFPPETIEDNLEGTSRNIVEFDINRFEKYTGFYYHWLYPEYGINTKVYFQLKTVKYADYKLYHFYVAPDLFIDCYDPRRLF